MKPSLEPGLSFEFSHHISEAHLVPSLLPESDEFGRMPRVLATGYMVGLIEWACIRALTPHLDWPREQTVGTQVDLSHQAATPPGLTVTVAGKLERIEGRRLFFSIEARDGKEIISTGTHQRYIIDKNKFDAKAAAKASENDQNLS